MFKNKNINAIALAILFTSLFIITGCEKDTTVVLNAESAVTKTVIFSKDLVPLFSKNCGISGCHATGGHTPVLTPELAYNSLIGGNFINKSTPASSILYKRLTGALTPAMPMGAASNPSNINALVLAWIKQGARKD